MTDDEVLLAVRHHEARMAHLLHVLDVVPATAGVVGVPDVAPVVTALNEALRASEAALTEALGRPPTSPPGPGAGTTHRSAP